MQPMPFFRNPAPGFATVRPFSLSVAGSAQGRPLMPAIRTVALPSFVTLPILLLRAYGFFLRDAFCLARF
jgi:hypothetical protein